MGVPQELNLLSLLFLVFIKDTVKSSGPLKFILFADDTSIKLSDSNDSTLYDIMNAEIKKVCDSISANKMALNINKTVYLLFPGKKIVNAANQIYIMFMSAMCMKNEINFLGLLIDAELSLFVQCQIFFALVPIFSVRNRILE